MIRGHGGGKLVWSTEVVDVAGPVLAETDQQALCCHNHQGGRHPVPHTFLSVGEPNAFRNHSPLRICSRRSRLDQCQSLPQMQQQTEKDEQEETFATKPLIDQIKQ